MFSDSAPSPATPPEPAGAPSPLARAAAAQVLSELRRLPGSHAASTAPQPSHWQQMVQGLLQPMHAAVLLGRDRELLMEALLPALMLLGFCLGAGFLGALSSSEPGILWPMLKTGLHSFAVLAPVPSIIMANHYGRLCAQAHERMQLGPCKPRQRSLLASAMLAVRQVVAVAVVVLPLSLAAHLVPWIGSWVARGLLLMWALHWIVVEALDDGCVDAEGHSEPPPPSPWTPWFLWPVHEVGTRLAGVPGAPLRFFVRRSRWLCSPWCQEITLVERNLPVMLGFAAATAALLCTPVLNLVFRPISVIAAVRLIGQLRLAERAKRSDPIAAAPAPALASAYAAPPHQGSC